MSPSRRFQIFESTSASARLDAAASFLRAFPPHQPITIVGATRGAADDLARLIAAERGATIGLSRFSLVQLAARVAATRLAGNGIAPATTLGSEAVAARVAFDAVQAGTLTYLARVAQTPGFPRALSQTLADLRSADIAAVVVAGGGAAGPDLARLLDESTRELLDAATADRARLFAAAIDAIADDAQLRAPLLLLDVAIESPAEEAFVTALTTRAPQVFATVPAHDITARRALDHAGGTAVLAAESSITDLGSLRTYLFSDAAPPERSPDGSLQFFSAPGEGRECVEIARRVLAEARRGVRFDEMAILVRAPQQYHGLLEHALQRAGIPGWFDRGTRRPHPAGRAFLALLACVAEGLSARRFAEYLSLGQVPPPGADLAAWSPSFDEVSAGARLESADEQQREEEDVSAAGTHDDEEQAAVAGTLRAPRRWERLLVEAAVIGGTPDRWMRRIDGLAAEFTRRRDEARRADPQSPRVGGLERDLVRLQHLRTFALPLVSEMAAWPTTARWGDWLDRLTALAPRVLGVPAYVLRVLADLHPMATVGPVSLDEVRSVLTDRLRLVDAEPPPRRFGRVFVGSPAQARGRAFRVVFLPGLAERMFPQTPRQDPLLLDAARARIDSRLTTRPERGRRERLLLHLAAGAATERLYVSYPRLEVAEGRGRVPSFYALDILRGATGRIPNHETLAADAAQAGDPSLAWPAPTDPALAIDDQEHDLSVLRGLLDARDPALVRGHAQYFLRLNPALRRSVTERWARGERRWTPYDGITRPIETTREALAPHRLGARPYSLSALQRFSACPYQFLLGAIYRLQPADPPQPLQRLDPLTKGSLVHRIQATFQRELQTRGALPVIGSSVEAALLLLDEVVARIAHEYEEELVPAIPRVWRDEVAAIARDLRGWVRHVAEKDGAWIPRHFELGFGLRLDAERDPASVAAPVLIDGRFVLHGSVDLVEARGVTAGGAPTLRVTDHKTGKDRHKDTLVIGGGAVLQPVLYSLVVEEITGVPVSESRLFFCTSAGGYTPRPVPLTPGARRAGLEALEIIDRAIEQGRLAAAPGPGACTWCDFRPVCGPNEEVRIRRKPADLLADVIELRSRP